MRTLFLILILGFVFQPVWSQDQEEAQTEPRVHAIGAGIESLSFISNYSAFLPYVDYTYKNDYVLALGFGPVLKSEMFLLDNITTKPSYTSFLEFKWYPFSQTKWFRPFIGLGYGNLKSNFETEYIVLTGESPYTYFVNHTVELQTTIKTAYLPIGLRIYFVEDVLYLEPSIRFQYVEKSVEWSEPLIEGDLKSNENIGRDLTDYRSPVDPWILDGGILEDYRDNFMFSIKFGYKF